MSFRDKLKSKLRRDSQSKRHPSSIFSGSSSSTKSTRQHHTSLPELDEEDPHVLPDATWETEERNANPGTRITPARQRQSGISALWNEAWDELLKDPETAPLARRYEALLLESAAGAVQPGESLPDGKNEQLRLLIDRQAENIENNEWKLDFQGYDFKVKSLIEPVVAITQSAKSFVASALEASPSASLAWAGVCLLLPLVLNPSEGEEARVKGLEYLSSVLRQCALRETVYQRRYESEASEFLQRNFEQVHLIYRESLRMLYIKILKFEATCLVFLAGNTTKRFAKDMVKWGDWNSLMDAVKARHASVIEIEDNWRDFRLQEEWEAKQQEHQRRVSALDAVTSELSRMRDLILLQQSQRNRSDLLHWLSSVADPSTNYAAARNKHTQRTGEWILQEERFRHWMSADNSLLWLHGIAGSGKSFISTRVIHYLQAKFTASTDQIYTAVAYFYFDFRDPSKQTRNNLLRSLIAQICQGRPDTPEPLLRLSKFRDLGQSPPTEELQKALLASIRGFSNVYIVIDALDECPQAGRERDLLMQCIQDMEDWRVPHLHIMVTSRREHDIALYLSGIEDDDGKKPISNLTAEIGLESHSSEMAGDVEAYINAQLSSKSKFGHWGPDLQGRVRHALIEKAQGMFQYVAIQLEVLQLTKLSMIEEALKELPDSINKVYERALQQSPDLTITIRALKWLAYSEGGMEIDKLAYVAGIKPVFHNEASEDGIEVKSLFDKDLGIAAPEDILRWLPSLVTLYEDNRRQYVRLCHFSLLEFIRSKDADKAWRTDPTEARAFIVQARLAHCIHIIDTSYCLADDGYRVTRRADAQANLDGYWPFNIRDTLKLLQSLPEQSYTKTMRGLVRKLFRADSKHLGCLRYFLRNANSYMHRQPRMGRAKPLQVLCRQDMWPLVHLVARLMPETVNMMEETTSDTILNIACRRGAEETVKFLLEAGADQFASNEPNSCALRQCLQEQDYDLEDKGSSRRRCVRMLVEAGGPEVVKRFAQNSSDGSNPLGWLSRLPWDPKESPALGELLIERGADATSALETTTRDAYDADAEEAITWLLNRVGATTMMISSLSVRYAAHWVLTFNRGPDRISYKGFGQLRLLVTKGGRIPPDMAVDGFDGRILHARFLTGPPQVRAWSASVLRSLGIVFGPKSRDGTYVRSPAEFDTDIERWGRVIRWLLSERASPWPLEVPSPGAKDVELFERWWKLRPPRGGGETNTNMRPTESETKNSLVI